MPKILAIETSGSVCGVGIWQNDKEPIIVEKIGNRIHSEKLPEFIIHSLKKSNLTINDLDALAVSSGPGSYTGLRIGMSLAKGLAFGSGIQLYPINTIDCIIFYLNRKYNYTILVYSHAGVVYEKNVIDNVRSDIHQVELMDIYDNPVICINFPDNRKNIKNAEYINPSVNYIGNYTYNNFDLLDRYQLDEISPGYYSEFNLRN